MQIVTTGEAVDIAIAELLGTEDLPQLAQSLQEAIERAPAVHLDVQTAEVGLGTLQLICSAHRTASAKGKSLAVSWGTGREMVEGISQAGFVRHVACPRSNDGDCVWLERHDP